ncbi:MAG TPA: hypothetical protein VH143_21255 [Kofleriaceae bacterium]|nr:hypothetical protein [Kofleriaceae bacterium]
MRVTVIVSPTFTFANGAPSVMPRAMRRLPSTSMNKTGLPLCSLAALPVNVAPAAYLSISAIAAAVMPRDNTFQR